MRERTTARGFLNRSRLFLYASLAALGGALGCAGKRPLPWFAILAAAAAPLFALARRWGWRISWTVCCFAFLWAGLFLGYRDFEAWKGRGGAAGEVTLLGEVEVGCRGEREEVVDLFEVREVLEGSGARAGDVYLLRIGSEGAPVTHWGDTIMVRGSLFVFERESGRVGGSLMAEELKVVSSSRNPLLRIALSYRAALREHVEGEVTPDAAGLIEGMVLGDYRLLGARDLKAFRLTGLIHLCAASGLNLAILAGFIVWLGDRIRLPRRLILVMQGPVLLAYALAVGLSVPILRATVVALAAAAAYLLGRDFDLLPAMGLAILLMLCNDPGAATGISFQLCFGAALGMVLLYRPLLSLMGSERSKVRELLAATLAAQLAVAPILLYNFGEVSMLAVLSNLLVLPLVAPVMALSMLASLFGTLGLPVAGVLMRAAGFLAAVILRVARTLSSPSWAALRIYPFSPAWMAVYYPALAAALLANGKREKAGRIVLASLLAAALVGGTSLSSVSLGGDSGMRITFIDVGQGDAALLQAPSGVSVLVDGGEEERVLTADLRERGVRFLDAVVVSHPEADHIGGLEGALENCEVGMLVHPGTKNSGLAARTLGLAEEMGVEVRVMRAGDRLTVGEITLSAAGPPRELPEGISVNESTLVLRAEGPGFSLLLPGDVEEEGEGMLCEYAGELECDILKVPHHGGFSERSEDFFARVDPEIAVISVGERNPYGHPAQDTLNALSRMGCSVYRTDQRGDIVIRVVEGGYRVQCER